MDGLDKLSKHLKEAQAGLRAMNGELAKVRFDPEDPQSVEKAVKDMKQKIDSKMAPHRNNPFVKPLVEASKKQFEEHLRKQAREKA